MAAMRPKVKESSTISIKKFVILIISLPNDDARIVLNTLGEILQPQPYPWLYLVSLIVRVHIQNIPLLNKKIKT